MHYVLDSSTLDIEQKDVSEARKGPSTKSSKYWQAKRAARMIGKRFFQTTSKRLLLHSILMVCCSGAKSQLLVPATH